MLYKYRAKRELQDIAAASYRSRGLEKAVLDREPRGEADGCAQRSSVRSGMDWILFRNLTLPL